RWAPASSTGSRCTSCTRSWRARSPGGSRTTTLSSSSPTGSLRGTSRRPRRSSVLLSERVNDVRPLEHALLLLRRHAVLDVRILEDVVHVAPRAVLPQEIGDHRLLRSRPREQERERVSQEAA